jgi:hypothetical protein
MAKSTAKTGKRKLTPNKLNIKDLPTKANNVVGGAKKLPDNWSRSGPCGS